MARNSLVLLIAWLNRTGKVGASQWVMITSFSLIVYLVLIHGLMRYASLLNFKGFNHVYSATTLIQGVVFGFFANHFISRWWDLRLSTGAVGGALVDIAMLLKGYAGDTDPDLVKKAKSAIRDKLKLVHLLHLCEILNILDVPLALKSLSELRLAPGPSPSLVSLLSEILDEVTVLVNLSSLSDAVKFSLLPAIQQNLSAVRSSSGDCTMILNTKLPSAFREYVYVFTFIHMASLPIYIGIQSEWDIITVTSTCAATFLIIVGFVILILGSFANPFETNGFGLEKIAAGTFDSIDECLGGPAPFKRNKREN
jgi:hypothetical protein